MKLPAVLAVSCAFHLIREGRDTVLARGVLRARVTQTCVVSLEEFDAPVEEVFQVRFVPSGEETDDIDPEVGRRNSATRAIVIDLGEAAAEQLGLALDPYPRMPGRGNAGSRGRTVRTALRRLTVRRAALTAVSTDHSG